MIGTVDLLRELADAAEVQAAVHALDLSTGREVGHLADDPQVPASVFKLPVLVELFRQGTEGTLDLAAPRTVATTDRAPGPYGLSVMQDVATLSARDLAWLMMSISDNAATDFLCELVGLENVNETLAELELPLTRVEADCRGLFDSAVRDLAVDNLSDVDLTSPSIAGISALDPRRGPHATTARESTRLLELIWSDSIGGVETCSAVRDILGRQVWPHRLASGFADDDDIRTFGKTGTLARVRNEVGVVEYPDGGRYAVAVFVTSRSWAAKQPGVDALIGTLARTAVDVLRGRESL